MGTLATRTRTHLNDALHFTESVAGSAYGNMFVVPGPPGKVHLLQHGFTCATAEGMVMIFVQEGNLSDCCYFKVLARSSAIEPIKVIVNNRSRTTNCPTLDDMLKATTTDKFKDPPTAGTLYLDAFLYVHSHQDLMRYSRHLKCVFVVLLLL